MATIQPTTTSADFPVPPPPGAGSVLGEQRFLISPITWKAYLAIAEALGDHSGVRMTYDRGRLELMSPGRAHEYWKSRLARLLECAAEEFGFSMELGGSMTFRREDLERGLEPDDCYWIGSAARMRGKLTWDPADDPPPDLVLEIEISRSQIGRMGIYSSLGVPEVWRFDGQELRCEILVDGRYLPGESQTFPTIPPKVLTEYASPLNHPDHFEMIRAFRAWLKGLRNQP